MKIKMRVFSQSGFSLLEIIVAIAILVVLLGIVLIAINPARQFSLANNTKRKSDILAVLNAIHQYASDNKGILPIGTNTTSGVISRNGINICAQLVTRYLPALPVDPQTEGGVAITDCTSAYNTDYELTRSTKDNRISIIAPNAELNEIIMATR